MTIVVRAKPNQAAGALPFAVSAFIHGVLLTWLVLGSVALSNEKAESLYDQEIKPYEKHIIWYNLRQRLPDVKPAETAAVAKPPRALRKFNQQILAGPKDLPTPPQLIRLPAPQIQLAKPLPLPNVLAAQPVKPVRRFVPPSLRPKAAPPPALPDAPVVEAKPHVDDLALAATRPRPLPFAAPRSKEAQPATLVLPPAPELSTDVPVAEAPRIPKRFAAPPPPRAAETPSPELAPPLVIVGLNPASVTEIPKLPGSHEAGFSAGPKPLPDGGAADSKTALLTVPGLLVRGGTKDDQPTLVVPSARQVLLAAMRPETKILPRAEPAGQGAWHASAAPDRRLAGREVYAVAIQMPNVTSYSGSWMIWFAEHGTASGGAPALMQPPVPLHKVDPKYVPAAADEKIAGAVRLYAVIRKNGQVDSVELIGHLDERLDRSAAEALTKWIFEPARRDGLAIDVDAVFEIPFRLAPKTEK